MPRSEPGLFAPNEDAYRAGSRDCSAPYAPMISFLREFSAWSARRMHIPETAVILDKICPIRSAESSMNSAQKHAGSCQCGRVRFEATLALEDCIECNCSHCYRKGLILAFVPATNFMLVQGSDALSEYLFNKHEIRHQFCENCGVQTLAYGQKGGVALVAVNVRTLEDVEPWTVIPKRVDGRSY